MLGEVDLKNYTFHKNFDKEPRADKSKNSGLELFKISLIPGTITSSF